MDEDDAPRFSSPVQVSRPVLPPMEDFIEILRPAWASHRLTNGAELHGQLESRLRERLRVENLALVSSATTGLLIACRALHLTGEVITTPFTFAATPHVLAWTGIAPVFCDVDPDTLGLSPAAVEAAITPRTTGILAVHVYGVPSYLEELEAIARRHGLALLFDAAHAFGVEIDGRGIGTFGDASVFSFHATKLFHTAEGGAVVCRDRKLLARVELLRNFGIESEEAVLEPGLNGKLSELQAALGLGVLGCLDEEWRHRAALDAAYRRVLRDVPGISLPAVKAGVRGGLTFFPIRVDGARFGSSRDQLQAWLRSRNVITRKYFFPLCSDYPCYRDLPSALPQRLPVAQQAAREFLCLPLHGGVDLAQVAAIGELIRQGPRRIAREGSAA